MKNTVYSDGVSFQKPRMTAPTNCGNSPRQELLLELTSAFSAHNIQAINTAFFSDQMIWKLAGSHSLLGKQSVLDNYKQVWPAGIEELLIQHIITHGKTASVNGELMMKGGSRLFFCDIYVFSSAGNKSPISEITSYRVRH
ncbi:Cif family virulence factor [Paenibacillus senegalensis]|uniref:hypothetical protein n=1 Tax=Paenibacillus senegalensis TaxID=1465766 RepID=UPI0002893296|nr:hypothetical protein [Paenibacillus senegalensis]